MPKIRDTSFNVRNIRHAVHGSGSSHLKHLFVVSSKKTYDPLSNNEENAYARIENENPAKYDVAQNINSIQKKISSYNPYRFIKISEEYRVG